MKALVFLAIFALCCVHALPAAEPVPVAESVPIAEPGRRSDPDEKCTLRNGTHYDSNYDLTGSYLYNPCGGDPGIFTSGLATYSGTYNVSQYATISIGNSFQLICSIIEHLRRNNLVVLQQVPRRLRSRKGSD
jgi:hypothetical protein